MTRVQTCALPIWMTASLLAPLAPALRTATAAPLARLADAPTPCTTVAAPLAPLRVPRTAAAAPLPCSARPARLSPLRSPRAAKDRGEAQGTDRNVAVSTPDVGRPRAARPRHLLLTAIADAGVAGLLAVLHTYTE